MARHQRLCEDEGVKRWCRQLGAFVIIESSWGRFSKEQRLGLKEGVPKVEDTFLLDEEYRI